MIKRVTLSVSEACMLLSNKYSVLPLYSRVSVMVVYCRQSHGLGGGVGSVGSVLVNGAAVGAGLGGTLGALSLSLSLAPPGTQPPAPITQHTLDHIKVRNRRQSAHDQEDSSCPDHSLSI